MRAIAYVLVSQREREGSTADSIKNFIRANNEDLIWSEDHFNDALKMVSGPKGSATAKPSPTGGLLYLLSSATDDDADDKEDAATAARDQDEATKTEGTVSSIVGNDTGADTADAAPAKRKVRLTPPLLSPSSLLGGHCLISRWQRH